CGMRPMCCSVGPAPRMRRRSSSRSSSRVWAEPMSAISELSQLKVSRGATREQRRAAKKAAGRDNKAAYLFLLPWLVGLVVITIGPMIASLYLSFTDYSLIEAPKWVGLANFTHMLHDPRLHQSLRVTFTYVLVGVPLQLLVALA